MKYRHFFILSLFISLLFTSCLADSLNKKFGYSTPVYITYHSEYGTEPARIKISTGSNLTSAELPSLTAENKEFDGWFLEESFQTRINTGYTINKNIDLYAKWR
ncbi:MAG: InlB B-repeat-containing protein [Treponema sp.]|jgi:uncharacterized repeat protein (TIGR02543 family)|nr:InlB B-repeat-containing protein [Treponema sp.]